jgi:hypothetical protein
MQVGKHGFAIDSIVAKISKTCNIIDSPFLCLHMCSTSAIQPMLIFCTFRDRCWLVELLVCDG